MLGIRANDYGISRCSISLSRCKLRDGSIRLAPEQLAVACILEDDDPERPGTLHRAGNAGISRQPYIEPILSSDAKNDRVQVQGVRIRGDAPSHRPRCSGSGFVAKVHSHEAEHTRPEDPPCRAHDGV